MGSYLYGKVSGIVELYSGCTENRYTHGKSYSYITARQLCCRWTEKLGFDFVPSKLVVTIHFEGESTRSNVANLTKNLVTHL